MKILYGITKSNWGGAQRYVFDLAVEAKRQGHDVAVLCGGKDKLVDRLNEENIRIIQLETLERDISIVKEIKSFFKILRTLKKERPNVFHINSSKMGGLGALAGRLSGVKKIIFTVHGWAWNEPRNIFQKIIIAKLAWLTTLLSHKVICVSGGAAREAWSFPFVQNKIIVIRNGIKEFVLEARKNNVVLTVGTIAELHKIKGLDILLKAWQKFKEKHDARLVIIGTGEEKDTLTRLTEELNISRSVEFRGFIDNARSHLSQFDIFVLPSRSEGLPFVLLEAGLASLSVIATRVGGIPEIIESGVTGVLIEPEDSEVLFSSLILLAENEDLRARLGSALHESVKENFSFEKMIQETFSLY